ncbi:5E5 antigen isoform X2 [Gadus morhua]|uniref:5E5 antigen isoform X2 n=1 Tax=Gadus morhua TaxID=8049 RepID=UPI0011B82296|nr:5E5 antigen-like isoform X2 [Gadus morhua]XP_030212184.1 5E5 antigen-like isoform X2 [Gadus morhua]
MGRERKCILCEMVCSSKQEMDDHMRTMLHHRELEKLKGRDCGHDCTVCRVTLVSLTDYAGHISSPQHKQNVEASESAAGAGSQDRDMDYFDQALVDLIEKRKELIRKEEEAAAARRARDESERLRQQDFQERLREAKELFRLNIQGRQPPPLGYGARAADHPAWAQGLQGKSATWHAQNAAPGFHGCAPGEWSGGSLGSSQGYGAPPLMGYAPGSPRGRHPWLSNRGSSHGLYGRNNIPQFPPQGRPVNLGPPQGRPVNLGPPQGRPVNFAPPLGGLPKPSPPGLFPPQQVCHRSNDVTSPKSNGTNPKPDKACRWSPYPPTKAFEKDAHPPRGYPDAAVPCQHETAGGGGVGGGGGGGGVGVGGGPCQHKTAGSGGVFAKPAPVERDARPRQSDADAPGRKKKPTTSKKNRNRNRSSSGSRSSSSNAAHLDDHSSGSGRNSAGVKGDTPRDAKGDTTKDTQADTRGDKQRETKRDTKRDTPMDTQRATPEVTQRDAQRDTQRDAQRDTQRDTQRDAQRDTQRDTQRNTPQTTPQATQRDAQRNTQRATQRDTQRNTPQTTPQATQRDTQRATQRDTQADRQGEPASGLAQSTCSTGKLKPPTEARKPDHRDRKSSLTPPDKPRPVRTPTRDKKPAEPEPKTGSSRGPAVGGPLQSRQEQQIPELPNKSKEAAPGRRGSVGGVPGERRKETAPPPPPLPSVAAAAAEEEVQRVSPESPEGADKENSCSRSRAAGLVRPSPSGGGREGGGGGGVLPGPWGVPPVGARQHLLHPGELHHRRRPRPPGGAGAGGGRGGGGLHGGSRGDGGGAAAAGGGGGGGVEEPPGHRLRGERDGAERQQPPPPSGRPRRPRPDPPGADRPAPHQARRLQGEAGEPRAQPAQAQPEHRPARAQRERVAEGRRGEGVGAEAHRPPAHQLLGVPPQRQLGAGVPGGAEEAGPGQGVAQVRHRDGVLRPRGAPPRGGPRHGPARGLPVGLPAGLRPRCGPAQAQPIREQPGPRTPRPLPRPVLLPRPRGPAGWGGGGGG